MSCRSWGWTVVVVIAGSVGDSEACDPLLPDRHVVDAKEKQVDTRPPAAAVISDVVVERGSALRGGCEGWAALSFRISARDDRSPPARLGYLVEVAQGTFSAPGYAIRPRDGRIQIQWSEEGIVDLPPLAVSLRITTVDSAGHRSATSVTIDLADDGLGDGGKTPLPADLGAACDKGDAAACTALGKRLRHAIGVPQNLDEARRRYQRGCDRGDGRGCEWAAALARPPERDKLLARAAKQYDAACKKKQARACEALARLSLGDRRAALVPLERACDAGLLRACDAALRWLDGGDPTQRVRAEALRQRRCEAGDYEACPDREERRIQQACDAGAGTACWRLGWLRLQAPGDQAAEKAAADLLARGCAEVDRCELSRAITAVAYRSAAGNRSLGVLQKACDRGDPTLCAYLDRLDEVGACGPPDLTRAERFRQKACEAGNAASCVRLGEAAEKKGGSTAAVSYFARGCGAADAPSCIRLGQACERLRAKPDLKDEHAKTCAARPAGTGRELATAMAEACERGSLDLCRHAAALFAREGDAGRARQLQEAACRLGDAASCERAKASVIVTGRVSDQEGAAVPAGLLVVVTQVGDADGVCRRQGKTDARGTFRISDACPGKSQVVIYEDRPDKRRQLAHAVAESRGKRVDVGALKALLFKGDPNPARHGTLRVTLGPAPTPPPTHPQTPAEVEAFADALSLLQILSVDLEGPMGKAGFSIGDIILSVDGRLVGRNDYDPELIKQLLTPGVLRKGQSLTIKARRGGEELERTVVADPL